MLFDNLWILAVLVAQLAWACGNFLDKHLIEKYGIGTQLIVSSLFGLAIATAIGVGAAVLGDGYAFLQMPFADIAQSMLVGALEVAWLAPYFYALKHSDEAEAAPLFQSVPIFALILGVVSFAEVPPLIHILGACTVIVGSLVLNYNFTTMRFNMRTVALMLLSSFIVALTAFLFKDAALGENYWGVSFWMTIGMTLSGALLWLGVPHYRIEFNRFVAGSTRRGWLTSAGNEVTDAVAIFAFNAALLIGPSVMVVQSTLGYQPIIILAIGLILARRGSNFHRERLSGPDLWKKAIGVLLIVIGTFFIFS